jgi:hypothetical protein
VRIRLGGAVRGSALVGDLIEVDRDMARLRRRPGERRVRERGVDAH